MGMLAGYIISVFVPLDNCGNILGMVAMMAGYSNAPLATAVLFTNMMGDYSMFVPFLVLSIISSHTNKLLMGKGRRLSNQKEV
jgi:H+/Cl- antiporter ClcA